MNLITDQAVQEFLAAQGIESEIIEVLIVIPSPKPNTEESK